MLQPIVCPSVDMLITPGDQARILVRAQTLNMGNVQETAEAYAAPDTSWGAANVETPDRPEGSSETSSGQPDQPRAEEQLTHLIDDHERPLSAFLYSLLPDPSGVSDCLQDTYMRAYVRIRNGDRVDTAWLYREGYNRVMDERRQRRG